MVAASLRAASIGALTLRRLAGVMPILFRAVARMTYLTPEKAALVPTIASEHSSVFMMRLTAAEKVF